MVSIFNAQLGMKKLQVGSVSLLLTTDNKRKRVSSPKECLELVNRGPD